MKINLISGYILLGAALGIVMIVFAITFGVYSNRATQNRNIQALDTARVNELLGKTNGAETASTQVGKTVEEMLAEEAGVQTEEITGIEGNMSNDIPEVTMATSEGATNQAEKPETVKKEVKKELKFIKPVEGDIIIEFAQDSLVFSKTLQEWITHKGIDIKADKTTIVKAAESGVIKSIKNDPRYGLTIIIEHEDGYKTIYSALLSAEFVVEGEKVEKGQTIGTVGNSAVFESSEEPHLHFELIKDDEYLDPIIYFK